MPALTLKQALRQCHLLWKELAESGRKRKATSPVWKTWKGKRPLYNCPLCGYSRPSKEAPFPSCELCPLLHLWLNNTSPAIRERKYMGPPCYVTVSPYRWWLEATTKKERKHYAAIIAAEAKALLDGIKYVEKRRLN